MESPLEMLVVAEYTSQYDDCGSQAQQVKILLQLLTAASQLLDFYRRHWFWLVNPFAACNSWRGKRFQYAGVINL